MTEMPDFQAAQGPFFEDFVSGQALRHGGRTVTEADNIWLTLLTCNSNPVHFDSDYASRTEFGRTLVNSTLTLAIATGLSVKDLSKNGINLGWHDVRMPAPMFPGDTLNAESTVLECRESKSRPAMGIVRVKTIGRRQDGTVVIEFERSFMVYKSGASPR